MKPRHDIDFSKLLGFALIADQVFTAIDLRDNTIGARLGAKVGVKVEVPDRPCGSASLQADR